MNIKEDGNKVKIIEELLKNARASLSELSEKTGLSRQTVAKVIQDLEKKKQIWGYATIIDPKLIDIKQYIILVKLNLSENVEGFLKTVTNPEILKDNEEKFGFKTTMFLHGNSDLLISVWAKDIIEVKKRINIMKKIYESYVKDIELFEVIATFRNCGILNPNVMEEWNNLLL